MSLSLDPTVELDLDALCARAAQLLEHAGADTADGRVREQRVELLWLRRGRLAF